MPSYVYNPVSGQHKNTNILSNVTKPFSAVYQEAIAPHKLKTFVERYDTTFNVYWQMLEKASEYCIEVYKHISGLWYKLTELAVDRNSGYVAISDLVGDGYVFRVIAEDRSGNILACSAGTVIGYDITE